MIFFWGFFAIVLMIVSVEARHVIIFMNRLIVAYCLFSFILFMVLLFIELFVQINKLMMVILLFLLRISKHGFNEAAKRTISLRMHIEYFIL